MLLSFKIYRSYNFIVFYYFISVSNFMNYSIIKSDKILFCISERAKQPSYFELQIYFKAFPKSNFYVANQFS